VVCKKAMSLMPQSMARTAARSAVMRRSMAAAGAAVTSGRGEEEGEGEATAEARRIALVRLATRDLC
jgi:hypothetical protein